MKKQDDIVSKLVDLELVTIDDYTGQTKLDPAIYKKFMNDRKADFEQDQSRVPIMEFKQYLIGFIKRQLAAVGVPE